MPVPIPHLSKKTFSGLQKLKQFPKRKNSNHESDSLAKAIKGNALLDCVSSGDLPRASEENFLTLKELSVHLSPTYTAHRSTANQHWACLHLSVSNGKEVCIQNAFISLCTPASVTYLGLRYDIYFQAGNL